MGFLRGRGATQNLLLVSLHSQLTKSKKVGASVAGAARLSLSGTGFTAQSTKSLPMDALIKRTDAPWLDFRL